MTMTAEMFAPLLTGITDNIGVLVPVGMTIMAAMFGIKLIPKIIGKFTK